MWARWRASAQLAVAAASILVEPSSRSPPRLAHRSGPTSSPRGAPSAVPSRLTVSSDFQGPNASRNAGHSGFIVPRGESRRASVGAPPRARCVGDHAVSVAPGTGRSRLRGMRLDPAADEAVVLHEQAAPCPGRTNVLRADFDTLLAAVPDEVARPRAEPCSPARTAPTGSAGCTVPRGSRRCRSEDIMALSSGVCRGRCCSAGARLHTHQRGGS